jgi:putative OPT family oligopeptide transporter
MTDSPEQPHDSPPAPRARGLGPAAFEPVPAGERYRPYVAGQADPPEVTIKAVVAGVLFGIAFGAANAYLGLRAGLTISTSIPVAVMTVAAFRAMRAAGVRGGILESNISQTIGSASSSVASGVIFTLPALFLWEMAPSLLQMSLLAMCGGVLGTLFMVPLRRYLIEREHGRLPYPEGTACAQVLVASEEGGASAHNVFLGLGVGAAFKFLVGWARAVPDEVDVRIPLLPKGQLGAEMSAALFGVGYILGPRIAAVMVGGGLLSWLLLIPLIAWWGDGRGAPLYPETVLAIADMSPSQIWSRYVRYIGAGAVATGGLITLVRSVPTMVESFRVGARQVRRRFGAGGGEAAIDRTDRDMSMGVLGGGVLLVVLVLAIVPQVLGALDSTLQRGVAAVLIALFAFFFVTVSSRIVGLVGVTSNPTSGMTIATLLGTSTVFLALGWTDATGKAAALTVGAVVAIAASIAGDTSQDLKTGFLLGATPWRQQWGELLGVVTSATFVCLTVIALSRAYGFGTEELPAPQATLMKLVIDGVLSQSLPWVLVAIGAGIAVAVELCRIPSLPFAVGVYLPVATMVPVFLGGALRWSLERRSSNDAERENRREAGVLLGSGFVGGEGLMGVGIALAAGWAVARDREPWSVGPEWLGAGGPWVAAGLFAAMVFWFARVCMRK